MKHVDICAFCQNELNEEQHICSVCNTPRDAGAHDFRLALLKVDEDPNASNLEKMFEEISQTGWHDVLRRFIMYLNEETKLKIKEFALTSTDIDVGIKHLSQLNFSLAEKIAIAYNRPLPDKLTPEEACGIVAIENASIDYTSISRLTPSEVLAKRRHALAEEVAKGISSHSQKVRTQAVIALLIASEHNPAYRK